jgi:hypothetical protein
MVFRRNLDAIHGLFYRKAHFFCHSEPFALCHSEHSEESLFSLRVNSTKNLINTLSRKRFFTLRCSVQNDTE